MIYSPLMSGTTLSTSTLDPRKKRLLIRAWHRGTKEMDIILGRFADANLHGMSEAELDDYEYISSQHDIDLLNWIIGVAPAPDDINTPMFKRIKDSTHV
jgi:antitoxin CptB